VVLLSRQKLGSVEGQCCGSLWCLPDGSDACFDRLVRLKCRLQYTTSQNLWYSEVCGACLLAVVLAWTDL
jgi:NADH:ubiquinone oxidoreductase subunit E